MLKLRSACVALFLLASACSPTVRAEVAAGASGAAALAPALAPVVCKVAASANVPATACGSVASDVEDVAALVAKILATWPRSARSAPAPSAAPVALIIRGVTVTLPADAAAYVQQQLGPAAK